MILIGVKGSELEVEEARLLRRVQPGGYILFGRNIKTAEQLRKLTDDLRDLSRTEPIITIDQEGGRVSRLRLIGNEPPNAQQLRDHGDRALIRRHGELTGQLLRLFGFNLDLCPVLDISFNDNADNSLRGRCYGRDVAEVIANAAAFNAALRETGIASCGKHFPGYSCAPLDAHHQLPKIDRSREQLDQDELAVFREFSPHVDSMMICHGWYPSLEPEKTPASLSRAVVTGLLRGELSYQGLVMTDDLDMGAILNEYSFEEMLQRAVAAGNDLAMICHRIEKVAEAHAVIDQLPAPQLDRALESISRFKARLQPPDEFTHGAFRRLDDAVWDLRVDVLGPDRAAVRSPEDGARSPVETY